MTSMDLIDKLVLRLDVFDGYLKSLAQYKGITGEQLVKDRDISLKVERLFELATEAVLDICRMLVSDQRLPIPEDYKGYILAVGKANIIDPEFAMRFAPIAGFRNILVHDYLDIDYGLVADKINNGLGDFERFAQEVAKFLESK